MTRDEHEEVAFWAVMTELEPGDIPLALLDDLRPHFLAARGDSRTAGRLLCEALRGIEWDWPVWVVHAKKAQEPTVAGVRGQVAGLSAARVLESAPKIRLAEICRENGLALKAADTKTELIRRIVAGLGRERAGEIAQPLAAALVEKEIGRCRKRMALAIAGRVWSIAHHAERYEQLADPDLLAVRPFWQFVWVDHLDAPKACRRFDGQVLPAAEAREAFPRLPCAHPRCCCRITPVRDKAGLEWPGRVEGGQ